MIETFIRFDAAEYIRTDENIAAYLDAIAPCGDLAVGA
jgi:DNA-binding phage protein